MTWPSPCDLHAGNVHPVPLDPAWIKESAPKSLEGLGPCSPLVCTSLKLPVAKMSSPGWKLKSMTVEPGSLDRASH